MKYRWPQAVNRFVGARLVTGASAPNREEDKTGLINRLFQFAWYAGQYRRRFKNWSRPAYMSVKFSLIAGVIALIVLV